MFIFSNKICKRITSGSITTRAARAPITTITVYARLLCVRNTRGHDRCAITAVFVASSLPRGRDVVKTTTAAAHVPPRGWIVEHPSPSRALNVARPGVPPNCDEIILGRAVARSRRRYSRHRHRHHNHHHHLHHHHNRRRLLRHYCHYSRRHRHRVVIITNNNQNDSINSVASASVRKLCAQMKFVCELRFQNHCQPFLHFYYEMYEIKYH